MTPCRQVWVGSISLGNSLLQILHYAIVSCERSTMVAHSKDFPEMSECPNQMTCFADPPQEHVFGPFKGTHEGPGRKTLIWAPSKDTHMSHSKDASIWKKMIAKEFGRRIGLGGQHKRLRCPKVLVDQVPCAARFRPDTLAMQNWCTSVMQHCFIPCTKMAYKHCPSKATNTTCHFCLNFLFSLLKHHPRPSINMSLHHTC